MAPFILYSGAQRASASLRVDGQHVGGRELPAGDILHFQMPGPTLMGFSREGYFALLIYFLSSLSLCSQSPGWCLVIHRV